MAIIIKGDGSVSTGLNADQVDGNEGSALATGYRFLERVIFTASGTFTKGNYAGLKAIGVHLLGGGAGGGGAYGSNTTATPAIAIGGGGGQYTWHWITDIASIPTSATVTVGPGGTGGDGTASPPTAGAAGGTTSFDVGTTLSADGGSGGDGLQAADAPAAPYVTDFQFGGYQSSGDLSVIGGSSTPGFALDGDTAVPSYGGQAGGPFSSGLGILVPPFGLGVVEGRGTGGTGATATGTVTEDGADGNPGLVVLDLYV